MENYGTLTEDIALLALCDSILEPITRYPVLQEEALEDDSYSLTVEHERQIAEAFAILLANTDDPSAVGPVCIEEQIGASGLFITIAVNSGNLVRMLGELLSTK